MGLFRFLRNLLPRGRRGGDVAESGEQAREGQEEADTGAWERVRSLLGPLRSATPDPGELASESAERLKAARDHAGDWAEKGAGLAQNLARHAGERIQAVWKPEDLGQVLKRSRLFRPLPGQPEEVGPDLLSLRWRGEALLALSAGGLLSLEDEIIDHTDRLFHAGLPTPELSERIFGADLSGLHEWIDTVPGSTVVGGGITHRLQHGHDLEAAATIYQEHGLEGVLAWTQHVGQDVFSITGIPVPVGGKDFAETLVERGAVTPGKAALVVSFNAVELAASFLAGAFALRLAGFLREMKTRRKVKKRCTAAFRARTRGDLDAVIANYAEARSLSDDPALSLALGWAYRELGRPAAESFLEFRLAALELGAQDRMIELDGVTVSLRGLAYLLALVEAPQVIQREDLVGAWREEMDRMVRGAVSSFEIAAISQSERPAVSLGDRKLEWRPRPLSAAANYYLAARTVVAVPFSASSVELPRLRRKALDMLSRVETDAAGMRDAALSDVSTRWKVELEDQQRLPAGP